MPPSADDRFPGLPPFSEEAARYGAHAEAIGAATALEPAASLCYGSDDSQRLHVYVPRGARDALRPVLAFFHGGAWVSGGLSWLRFMAPAVTQHGAVFVAGTYRLAPAWRWPAAYDDVRAAIDLVHARVGEFGGDRTRMIVGGHSAGGHLCALAVLKRAVPPVLACFPVSTSFDLQYGDVPLDSAEGRVYKYLFAHREQDAEASPVNFVGGNRTLFHIAWGERDFPRIARSSAAMVARLREAGSPVTSEIVPGAGHFDTHLRLADERDAWYGRLREAFAHD